MSKPNFGILGLGVAVPDRILSNADLEKMVETSDEWIVSRTGIKERHVLSPGEHPSSVAIAAAKRAMEDAKVSPGDIDLLICATYTPDYLVPSTACIIQNKLGLRSCMAYDMNAACTGFVYGLQQAHAMMVAGLCKRPLVIGMDCASRLMDYTDRDTCVLFGDGAGAVVLGEVPEGRGFLGHFAGADGTGAELIYQKVGGAAVPATADNVNTRDRWVKMNGREVFKFAVRVINEALEKSFAASGITAADMDLFVPHQANIRIIDSAVQKFSIPQHKVVTNMDRYGNTSSASIPLALDTARQDGRLKPGTTCALVAFGAGLTYGSTIVRW